MLGLQIADIKDFTNKLFRQEVFDHFLVPEAAFITTFSIAIDGNSVSEEGKPVCSTWGPVSYTHLDVYKRQLLNLHHLSGIPGLSGVLHLGGPNFQHLAPQKSIRAGPWIQSPD